MLKKVMFIATTVVSSLVFVSCGDERVEMVKNYNSDRQKDSSVKINLPQEIVIDGENIPSFPSDSIAKLEEKKLDLEKSKSVWEESVEGYKRKLKEEKYESLVNFYLRYIKSDKERIKKIEDEINLVNSEIDSYLSLDQTVPLAYYFDATIITSVPLNDTSIEVTNTYVTDASGSKIVNVFRKSNNLFGDLK